MSNRKSRLNRFIAIFMMVVVMLSGAALSVFAQEESDNIKFEELKLGVKNNITFTKDADDNIVDGFYIIKIPKSGKYKRTVYSTYSKDYTDDFWVDIFRTAANAKDDANPIESIGRLEKDEVFNLKAGDYYIKTHKQGFNENRLNMGIKIAEVTEEDLWMLGTDGMSLWPTDEEIFLDVFKETFSDREAPQGVIISVTSSNKKVVAVKTRKEYVENGKTQKSFYLVPKKAGKSTVTVKYKRPNGKKATIKRIMTVKKYPAHIKSLKVNGKTIKTSKNKYSCNINKYKKTSSTVKMQLKKGWRVTGVYLNYYTKKGGYTGKELNTKVVTNGKKISFPKKYERMDVDISMHNDKTEDFISYMVHFTRGNDKLNF